MAFGNLVGGGGLTVVVVGLSSQSPGLKLDSSVVSSDLLLEQTAPPSKTSPACIVCECVTTHVASVFKAFKLKHTPALYLRWRWDYTRTSTESCIMSCFPWGNLQEQWRKNSLGTTTRRKLFNAATELHLRVPFVTRKQAIYLHSTISGWYMKSGSKRWVASNHYQE